MKRSGTVVLIALVCALGWNLTRREGARPLPPAEREELRDAPSDELAEALQQGMTEARASKEKARSLNTLPVVAQAISPGSAKCPSPVWGVQFSGQFSESLCAPIVGHGDPEPHHYDIFGSVHDSGANTYDGNCHNAADDFVKAAHGQAGVLVCQGDPITQPSFHTAAWIQFDQQSMCVYNWGSRCCWQGRQNPPDVKSSQWGRYCASWACGNQYRPNGPAPTRALKAGWVVEEASPMVCVRQALNGHPYGTPVAGASYSANKQSACLACCATRADGWTQAPSGETATDFDTDRKDFQQKCSEDCRSFLF